MRMKVIDIRSKHFGRIGTVIATDISGDVWIEFDCGIQDCFDITSLAKVK